MEQAIKYDEQGNPTSFNGEGVNVYRAALLASSIGVWIDTKIMPTRGVGITAMLKMATGYTNKVYRRKEACQAVNDLYAWVQRRKLELSVDNNN